MVGIRESEFWDMTLGEVIRFLKAYQEKLTIDNRTKAYFDYQQVMLFTRGVGLILGGKGDMPSIEDAYPDLFDKKDTEEHRADTSTARFIQFANQFNKNFKEE